MSTRQNIASGAPWEAVVAYSRAVRIGHIVAVAGTTAVDAQGEIVGADDAGTQTRCWEAVGRAHGEVFAGIRPATTMVEVSRLIDPRMLVEIEADAVLAAGEGR